MKINNILIECEDSIIGAIQSLWFINEFYEDFFPMMSGGRVRFDREKLSESGAFHRDRVTSYCQNKPLKIIITTTDSDDLDFKEEIVYPNVLVVKSGYTFTTNDCVISDEMHFAIAASE